MIPKSELMTQGDYARALRPLLPAAAFRPSPKKLWRIAVHLTVMIGGLLAVRASPTPWLYPLATVVIGHSSACVAFLTHDLGHGSILRTPRRKRLLETVLWALNMVPATFWLRVHMQAHHGAINTLDDPDRKALPEECTPATHRYVQVVMPSASTWRRLPTVFISFPTYVARYAAYAFVRAGVHVPTTVARPRYRNGDRRRLTLELALIVAIQVAIFHAVGGDWLRYVFVGPLAIGVASSVVMAYIFTNHMLNPHLEIPDPLIGTTSVVVPSFLDRLHAHFSFHTEHHVFPGLDSDYYPQVAALLQARWPERYHQLPMAEAWRRLWEADEHLGPDFVRSDVLTLRGTVTERSSRWGYEARMRCAVEAVADSGD